jgi:hypothetical protein
MLSYNFYDLSRVPLSHAELAAICCDAYAQAKDPSTTASSCPYEVAPSRHGRYKRLVWRSVFRRLREADRVSAAEITSKPIRAQA